ncbi:hypothetical protein OG302_39805 [Streptomyces sp. NBC_01283]|uniref:hypothetical protein n=1 Tax=Streptomyces sp. NBC_01283 TaxID=2903812 RepID=UPI00352FA8C2|nr:hypothetical protein OG302_39805 [Streptomyces sp. NBC_01283]
MLSIVDDLAGIGPLRMCAHAPSADDPDDLTGLRVLLVADVLARVVELRGRTVLIGWTCPPAASADAAGIRPADAHGTADEIAEALGGPPTVHLTSRTYEGAGGLSLHIGEATTTGGAAGEGDRDALALRLLLLSHPHHEPVDVSAQAVDAAREKLANWRKAVAAWADEPSKAMPAVFVERAGAALENGLDTPAVLRLLGDLEAAVDVPSGAKFETFAHLDRVLALEVVRDVGRSHSTEVYR